jgi:hypothetical protein
VEKITQNEEKNCLKWEKVAPNGRKINKNGDNITHNWRKILRMRKKICPKWEKAAPNGRKITKIEKISPKIGENYSK